jgi:hypothetical protein
VTTVPSQQQEGAVAAKKKAAEDTSITEWMEVFRKVYEKVDSKRSPVEMWVAATAHCSFVGEAIRRVHFADLMYSASHAFCWMCSFLLACHRAKATVFALDESFSAIVACKYPLVCGHCRDKYCHCNPQLMDKTPSKAARYRDLLGERALLVDAPDTYTVSQWLTVFNQIYGQHIHMLTLESTGFHFLEEAGEELTAVPGLMQLTKVLEAHLEGIDEELLAELATFEGAVARYDQYWKPEHEMKSRDPEDVKFRLAHAKVDMFVEFADTFSWFCSILNKVSSIAKNCGDSNCAFKQEAFGKKMEAEYLPDGKPRCPSCKACPCVCVFFI